MKRLFLITIISLFILGGTSALADETPKIVGDYIDNYGGLQQISNTEWSMGSPDDPSLIFTYTSVDNKNKVIIAKNTKNSPKFSGKFSQFDWTYDKRGLLWYCQQVYDADTAKQAADRPYADTSDPCSGGCGIRTDEHPQGFPWSQLIVYPDQQ
ncbi:MAG: hypothetical protein AAGA60_01475 [Cyanobacteria bacterium P01_E01_bin.42]